MKGKPMTEEHKQILIKSLKKRQERIRKDGNMAELRSKEFRETMLKLWNNPIWRDKHIKIMLSASIKRPTKPEKQLIDLILKNKLPFTYCGNGSTVINGKNPDFINNNGEKQLIEIYGDYWHKGEDGEDRKRTFAELGFSTLIIWEHEFIGDEEEKAILKRISDFRSDSARSPSNSL